ncbi:MAG: TetR/AcrR family transcriptional regulator [Erysipelotrichaceae bacterium]|nr:TetR/AcrR family transcriptional regulator [Erysipelotrichaceae bacterium]
METKEDLRVMRTRKLLSMALFQLLQEQPFDKINVNDICEKSMVHRATFYNHFKDKNDLLNYIMDGIQEYIFEKSIEKETYQTTKEMYLSIVSNLIDFMTSQRKNLAMIFRNSLDKMLMLVSETIKRSLYYLMSKNKYKEEYLMPSDFIINFFTGGITTIGIDWLQSDNPYSKEELLSYFDILLDEKLFLKQKD